VPNEEETGLKEVQIDNEFVIKPDTMQYFYEEHDTSWRYKSYHQNVNRLFTFGLCSIVALVIYGAGYEYY